MFLSCGDEYYGPGGPSGQDPGPYSIETEASISPDGDYIYYIADDTITVIYSGIYRALIANPVREKILYGHSYHSPTVNFDDKTVAYLDSGIVNYYDFSLDSGYVYDSGTTFNSLMYINEDILLAGRSDSFFIVYDSGQSYFLKTGRDPTFTAPDTFVYIDRTDSIHYHIIKYGLPFSPNPETLLTLETTAWPRWPSYHAPSNRIVYGLEYYHQKFIYTFRPGDSSFFFLDSSTYSKPLILKDNLIIYTGPDGRFYKTDSQGVTTAPFTNSGQ
jgi:hypothetical protein